MTSDLLALAEEALARGDWEAARENFQELLEKEETPEALEGLGRACWWLDDVHALFATRERAFQLYRDRGNDHAAARLALHLAEDSLIFRGEPAVFNGWMERARRLLGDGPINPEHAFLAVREAFYGVLLGEDTSVARRRAGEAIELARRFDLFDLEMLARSIEGVSLVSEGEVTEGMRRLDEATAAATGGEMRDIELIALTCCFMITACERTRDFDRAAQWCLRVQDYCQRFGLRSLFAICRAHYGGVLTARGEWTEAERELLGAGEDLASRPAQATEFVVRLAELRRRQGRLDEAQELLDQIAFLPEAQAVLAAIALDRDDASRARDLADRFLRQVPERDRTQRAHGLELLIRARVALGDLEGTDRLVAELRRLADDIRTPLLRAAAADAEGILAAATGSADAARAALQDAVDLYEQSGLVFEAAEARLALAAVHHISGALDPAIEEAEKALERLDRLGASHARERTASFLRELREGPSGRRSPLTPREEEVLRLVAGGLGDRQIAERLTLSEHTVHRHVSNILTKLGVPSRAAAVARATADELI